MKAETQTERRLERKYHKDELDRIYKIADSNDIDDEIVAKHRKEMAAPREDLVAMIVKYCKKRSIPFCSAPFEADWQLVKLQNLGIIKHIMSIDGDLFLLGGNDIVTEVSTTSSSCCIYYRDKIMSCKSMGRGKFDKYDLPLIGCFSGNDYIKRLNGNGHKRVLKLMKKFKGIESIQEKEEFINQLEKKSKWSKQGKAPATRFANKFWKAYYLQLYAPVFDLCPTLQGRAIDLRDATTYAVSLGPLNPLPPGTTAEQWGDMIGFGCDPSSLLESNLSSIIKMECWGESHRPPEELPLPKLSIEPNHEVPHGSYLDERIPTKLQSEWSLSTFLGVRNLAPRGKFKRNMFVRIADKVLKLMKSDPSRAPQPMKHDPNTESGSYSDNETLIPREGDKVTWSSSWSDLKSSLLTNNSALYELILG